MPQNDECLRQPWTICGPTQEKNCQETRRMKEDVFNEKEEIEIGIGYLTGSYKSILCLNICLEQINK